ncbi:MAG: hypothetical protein Q9M22_01550 [Mariprofundaceae bacterium]|nr:hypothetical protein [Mariprofundaceae bacterium]
MLLRILTGCIAVFLSVSSLEANEFRSVNIAVFQKEAASFEFDPIVVGSFKDFIGVMEGSQVLLISHTSDAKNGDVINIQQDVLRESNGEFSDTGINCQFSFYSETDGANLTFLIAGICHILGRNNSDLKEVISPTMLPDALQGEDAWVELYENEKTGIAFYANVGKPRGR